MSVLDETVKNIINLPRYVKRIIFIFIDISLCILSTWIAFYLRLEEFIRIDDVTFLAVLMSLIFPTPT
mgnify:CR=1 FL=1